MMLLDPWIDAKVIKIFICFQRPSGADKKIRLKYLDRLNDALDPFFAVE